MSISSNISQTIGRLFGLRSMPIVRPITYSQPGSSHVGPHPQAVEIESSHKFVSVSGTTYKIGPSETLSESPSGSLVYIHDIFGLRLGCGHIIFQAIPKDSMPGLGGECSKCAEEAMPNYQQGLISIAQLYLLSLYCSNCASHCDPCHRNLCKRHTTQSANASGQIIQSCPDCIKAMQRDRMFQTILAFVLSSFVNDNESNNLPNGGSHVR
jgi:hypothetical protein